MKLKKKYLICLLVLSQQSFAQVNHDPTTFRQNVEKSIVEKNLLESNKKYIFHGVINENYNNIEDNISFYKRDSNKKNIENYAIINNEYYFINDEFGDFKIMLINDKSLILLNKKTKELKTIKLMESFE